MRQSFVAIPVRFIPIVLQELPHFGAFNDGGQLQCFLLMRLQLELEPLEVRENLMYGIAPAAGLLMFAKSEFGLVAVLPC